MGQSRARNKDRAKFLPNSCCWDSIIQLAGNGMRQGTTTGCSSKTPLRMLRKPSDLQRPPGVRLQLPLARSHSSFGDLGTPQCIDFTLFMPTSSFPTGHSHHSKGMVTLPGETARGEIIP